MRSSKAAWSQWVWVLPVFVAGSTLVFAANGCVGDAPVIADNPNLPPLIQDPDPIGDNIMTLTVNGDNCGPRNIQYANQPCVKVTICESGTNHCQEIDNILLDTGSYGLRLFKSVVTVPLAHVTVGGKEIAECVHYGDGSSQWGPVQYADVRLGNEPRVRVPIQLIDTTYSTMPAPCSAEQSRPDYSPSQVGFNGILGLGLFALDCGPSCMTEVRNGQYWACQGNNCTQTALEGDYQVQNPVALLPRDKNGVILKLPTVPAQGLASLVGSLVFGIGTQPNNVPSGVKAFRANANGDIKTLFSATSPIPVTSFIDSGSSALFFPPPTDASLPECNTAAGGSHGSRYRSFFCPAANLPFTAEIRSETTAERAVIPFEIGNAYDLLRSGNKVIGNLGNSSAIGADGIFDWGLPFFYGRDVYIQIEDLSSPLGTGPLWAF